MSTEKTKQQKPKKSLKRKLANGFFYLIILIFILSGLTVLATDTDFGFQTALKLSKPILRHYGVDITGDVTGDLYDFQISQLQVSTSSERISLKDLSLTWNPVQLWHRHLEVKQFRVIALWPFKSKPSSDQVHKPDATQSTPLEAIQAPDFTFDIDHFDFHLQTVKKQKLMEVTGAATLKDGKFILEKVLAEGSGFKTQVNGFVDFEVSPQIMLTGPWQFVKGKRSFKGALTADGDFKNYQIQLQGRSEQTNQSAAFNIDLEGNLQGLHSKQILFKRMDGTINGQLQANFLPLKWQLQLEGKDIDIHQQVKLSDTLLNFTLKAKGDPTGQNLEAEGALASNKLTIKASRTPNGSIHIAQLTMQSETGTWQLTPTTFDILNDNMHLPKTCLKQAKSYVCGNFDISKGQVQGALDVNLLDLSEFNSFFPQLNDLTGEVLGNMTFFGSTARPNFKGQVRLKDAGLGIPSLGIQLNKTNLILTSEQKNKMTLKGVAHSVGGELSIDGGLYWEKTYPVIAVGITGKEFTVVNLPEAHIVVSPQLSYIQNNKIEQLVGTVTVDSADVNADRFENTIGLDKSNIVYINSDNQVVEQEHSLPFATTIQVLANNTLKFRGFGINATIGGKILINGVANQNTVANGTLNISSGHYAAYGKRFNVTKGQMIFSNSPIDDPALDVYAQYEMTAVTAGANNQLNSIKVGVHVSGTVQKIHLSLYSDPPMTQENILSYIITGQSLDEVGPGGQAALSQAALSFAAGGGDDSVLSQIKEKLQLSELSVGSLNTSPTSNLESSRDDVDQNNTAVFIGKALSKRFYVSYGVGLFNQQQIFKTHFKLTKNWAVQTDNSTLDSGADIIYTFER